MFESDAEWEKSFTSADAEIEKAASHKGKLGASKTDLLAALRDLESCDKKIEALYNYASLQAAADETDSDAQQREARIRMKCTRYGAQTSFFNPELQAIADGKITEWMRDDAFADYRVFLKKILRLKAHILSEREEKILSLQSTAAGTAQKAFTVLSDADMQFGEIDADGEKKELTQSTWNVFMRNENRAVRKKAYKRFYAGFASHENTLAALYAGSVHQDIFVSRARHFSSSLSHALFYDNVDESVYRNLIDTIHGNLKTLHGYYALRKKILGVRDLRHYDVYVPLVKTAKKKTSYEEAVELCRHALSPLGNEYTETLCEGLLSGWVDRYENKGKRSGAFSSGVYRGNPYILMNYKNDNIRDVFTMAHEGGHSMHTYYSVRNNPYMQYNYTIFAAEVASTFNEDVLFHYLLKNATDHAMKLYLLSMRADDIVATLFRQTMFAEYELAVHETAERGEALSPKILRNLYRNLLEKYFGHDMVFENESDLEGLRIPHFYNAFYVYKYATGISAALALSARVRNGGNEEKNAYVEFLKSGGTFFPIDALKKAGVDMNTAEPIQAACDEFASIVQKLSDNSRLDG